MKTILFSLTLFLAAGLCRAAEETKTFTLIPTRTLISERGEVLSYQLKSAEHSFTLIPPAEWRTWNDPTTTRINWMGSNQVNTISLLLTNYTFTAEQQAEGFLSSVILERYPKARVTSQFSRYSGLGAGVTFDLEWPSKFNGLMRSQHTFFSLSNGTVEVSLTTTKEAFPQHQYAFSGLLNSLRWFVPATPRR